MMTKKEVKELIDSIHALRAGLSDEQAAEVPAIFPEWKEGKKYKAGDRVRYNGELYRMDEDYRADDDHRPDRDDRRNKKISRRKH